MFLVLQGESQPLVRVEVPKRLGSNGHVYCIMRSGHESLEKRAGRQAGRSMIFSCRWPWLCLLSSVNKVYKPDFIMWLSIDGLWTYK